MAKAQEARQRGARPAAGNGSDVPQDTGGTGAEPLRTTGYSRSTDNSGGYVHHVIRSMAGALVLILVMLSYNYGWVSVYPPLRSSNTASSSTYQLGNSAAGGEARDDEHMSEVKSKVDTALADINNEKETKPVVPVVEPPNPYKKHAEPTEENQADSGTNDAMAAVAVPWPTSTILKIFHDRKDCQGSNFTQYETSKEAEETDRREDIIVIPEGIDPKAGNPFGKSMQIIGPGEAKLYNQQGHYVATVVEMEKCLTIFPWPPVSNGILTHRKTDPGKQCQIEPEVQKQFSTAKDLTKPHTRVVYSAESSDKFGYQTLSNAYAFLNSSQTEASWTRLLTCETPDDLAQKFPTFTAPRSPYSKRYGPINKPDVIEKWFASECDAPDPNDTIVVIDPDNFLMRDLAKWTAQVSRKNALGQGTYYTSSPKVDEMWKEVCEEGCDNEIDKVGVPYVVKAADLKEIAPLWRHYTIKVKELGETDPEFNKRYEKHLNIVWAAEMFGYNYACTHLSIKTKILRDMQARDVDPSIPLESSDPPAMIHMGRAWFPKEHQEAADPFRHTEGNNFLDGNTRAVQVFCKCNQTASTVMPWPLPEKGLDWQSYHTLRLMHDGMEHFGGVPENEVFRHKPPEGYYWNKN